MPTDVVFDVRVYRDKDVEVETYMTAKVDGVRYGADGAGSTVMSYALSLYGADGDFKAVVNSLDDARKARAAKPCS